MTPDAELIRRVVAHDDHAAFGLLVQRHQSAVRKFLRHLTGGDHALADDLAQETFVQAFRGLDRFRGGSALSTWLLGIAHNQWRNARRRPWTVAAMRQEMDAAIDSASPQSDLRHDLAEALRTLSADEQLAIHVCYQQGLTHQEAAVVLDWPLGTVKTHLARGKDKLRQQLAVWNPNA